MPFDYLKDITGHTFGLGIIDVVKVTGSDTETTLDAMAGDRSVIVQAKSHTPIAEFVGQFGMPQLGKLNTILNIPEYKEDSKITVTKDTKTGEPVPVGLHFENKVGDFKNDYRFMSAVLINEQLKQVKFKGVKWNVEFEPTVQQIQRLKFMAGANSDETTFIAKTENGALKFFFGDHSSHAGNFVFAEAVSGTVAKGFHWPVAVIQSILALPGDKTFRISDEGVTKITVDSGLIAYDYLIPAQQK
jgi:thiamine pyrophosphokinase